MTAQRYASDQMDAAFSSDLESERDFIDRVGRVTKFDRGERRSDFLDLFRRCGGKPLCADVHDTHD
ncbi:MAG: hypothetical protein HY703_04550 [Gemmatimonadetes bacterium]|nr:hypothetical protein [Gemmatimonadota bacterium]